MSGWVGGWEEDRGAFPLRTCVWVGGRKTYQPVSAGAGWVKEGGWGGCVGGKTRGLEGGKEVRVLRRRVGHFVGGGGREEEEERLFGRF